MSKRKLLLADDSITIQKVVNLTFADEGIEVITVGDGDSAMRKFDEFMPDLVMADVNMPGLNGYEVCRIIKQTEETRRIPVILLVGSFEPFDELEAKQVGADDFLTKPFQSIRQLVNKVTELLNQKEKTAKMSPAEVPAVAPVSSFADTAELVEPPIAPSSNISADTFDFSQLHDEPAQTETPADTFADTLELKDKEDIRGEFGDAGMDDEMIETSAVNNFAAESEMPDYSKTQPLSADDWKGFSLVPNDETAEKLPETTENREDYSELRQPPATFDEEAKKLEYPSDKENYTEKEPEIESHSESKLAPENDYYAPVIEKSENVQSFEPQNVETEENFSNEPQNFEEKEFVSDEPQVFELEKTSTEPQENTASDSGEIENVSDENLNGEIEEAEGISENVAVEDSEFFETRESESDLHEEITTPTAEIKVEPFNKISENTAVSATNEFSPMNFDDGDLLELPSLVEETGIRPQVETQNSIVPTVVPNNELVHEPQSKITLTKTVAESEISVSFPPELIEAIAQKVAEKISAKTLNDILPQLADLVVKKLAEQRKE